MDNRKLMDFFQKEAAEIDRAMRADLALVKSDELSEVLQYAIFNGGKRIRPQLTMLCAGLAGNEEANVDRGQALRLAIVFEYIHAASLLHDDVIDNSEKRRGKPTANAVWGLPPVILAGDYLLSRAMNLAGEVGGKDAMSIVGRATEAMVEAEFLQARMTKERNPSEANYFTVVAGKTGALIAAACEAGVYVAGGNDAQRAAIRLYGENIGLAFQIIDDLLDYQGDPARTGKAVGNDLVEGKMTLPLLYILRKGGLETMSFFEEILAADGTERRHRFAEAKGLIEKHGGFGYARRKAEELVAAGLEALSVFLEGPELLVLKGLAGYVLSRDK